MYQGVRRIAINLTLNCVRYQRQLVNDSPYSIQDDRVAYLNLKFQLKLKLRKTADVCGERR